MENKGGCSGQKQSVVLTILHSATSSAVPWTSLEQVVQKELALAPAGVISNAVLRRTAPRLPSNSILFFNAVLSFFPTRVGDDGGRFLKTLKLLWGLWLG